MHACTCRHGSGYFEERRYTFHLGVRSSGGFGFSVGTSLKIINIDPEGPAYGKLQVWLFLIMQRSINND